MGKDARRRRDERQAQAQGRALVTPQPGAFELWMDAEHKRVLFRVPVNAATRQILLRAPGSGLDLRLPAPDARRVLEWFDAYRDTILGWTAEAPTSSAAPSTEQSGG
jgi:hypothetical protein